MQAWINFFTTDYGLMSLVSILLLLGMLGYIGWFVHSHVKADTAEHDRLVRDGHTR